MNVIDRNLSVQAGHAKAKREARRKSRTKIILGVAAVLIVAAALCVIWVFTLCGDCGAPTALPLPPA